MRDNALYFPYINVPDTAWFTRILLYWDRVNAIVPYEYVANPDELAPHMREMVAAGLVEQLFPGPHLYNLPNFTSAFMTRLENRFRAQRHRLSGVVRQHPVLLHIEKLGDIADELVQAGVARPAGYPWYEVEPSVAADFMIYLALTLGQLPEVDAAPVTNDRHSFGVLGGTTVGSRYTNRESTARAIILKHIFPVPQGQIAISELADFKAAHGHLLRRLRRRVEIKCTELSNIEDPEIRRNQTERIAEDLREEVEAVAEEMRRRFSRIALSAIVPIIGGIAGFVAGGPPAAVASAGSGMVSTVYAALDVVRQQRQLAEGPLAYAAIALRRFPRLQPLPRDRHAW